MQEGRMRFGRKWARVSVLAAIAALGVGVVACGDDDSSGGGGSSGKDKEVTIGLITKTESNPFFVKMKEGAEAAAKEHNVKLLTASGKFDTDNASQVTALENMTTQGAKVILDVPADSKAVVPAVKKARDAGVLVISLDTPTANTAAPATAAARMPKRFLPALICSLSSVGRLTSLNARQRFHTTARYRARFGSSST